MAKHAKKNNIISYDEAKFKKLQEKEEQRRKVAKHVRHDIGDTEELNEDSYYNDTQNNNFNDRFNVNSDYHIDDEPKEQESSRYQRRSGKYAQESEPLPRNLINLIIVALMVLFLTFISIMMYNYYVVETIDVVGNHEIKYHDITRLCGVEYKQSMLSVKKEDIVESFESQMPMIEVVDVKKVWPNILEIHVKERPPVCFIVLKGSQKCALIGEDNICLSIVDSYLDGDMPRIYGLDVGTAELSKEIIDGETRKLEVLKQIIAAMIETDCISELESININNTTNITMVSTSGTNIKIGDASNLNTKFSNIKTGIRRLILEDNTDATMVVTGDNAIYIE